MPKFTINLKRGSTGNLELGKLMAEMSPDNKAQISMNEAGDVTVEYEVDAATVRDVKEFLAEKFNWHGWDNLGGLEDV